MTPLAGLFVTLYVHSALPHRHSPAPEEACRLWKAPQPALGHYTRLYTAVTHVKRLPDRATRTAARTPLSAENGAREGADGARAGLERGKRTAGADGPD